jgi:hypothetical protein
MSKQGNISGFSVCNSNGACLGDTPTISYSDILHVFCEHELKSAMGQTLVMSVHLQSLIVRRGRNKVQTRVATCVLDVLLPCLIFENSCSAFLSLGSHWVRSVADQASMKKSWCLHSYFISTRSLQLSQRSHFMSITFKKKRQQG